MLFGYHGNDQYDLLVRCVNKVLIFLCLLSSLISFDQFCQTTAYDKNNRLQQCSVTNSYLETRGAVGSVLVCRLPMSGFEFQC